MYKINFEKYFKILNWSVIYWGIKSTLIDASSAIDYANKIIENNPKEEEALIIELFILENIDKDEVLLLIGNSVSKERLDEEKSMKILRYIILDSAKKSNKSVHEILDEIGNIYADFNYPSDMNSFVSYMPIEDDNYNPAEHTPEENEQRLFELFNTFLDFELQQIKNYI